MKKTLLLLVAVAATQTSFGQEIFMTEDFSNFTPGNLGTDFTGATAGQGGLYTFASNGAVPTTTNNASNENFQIVVSDGDNALQLTGPNGDKGSRIAWKGGLADHWAARADGNNIIEVEFDFYTGATTDSQNNMRMVIYDVTRLKVLGGFSVNMATKVISGVANYDASAQPGGSIGNYLFFLGGNGVELTLDEESWVTLGVSYDYTTGRVTWRGPGINGFVMGAAAGTDPDEVDIAATSGSTATVPNTAATTGLFDNIIISNTDVDSLLGLAATPAIVANQLSAYPNPANDVVTISNDNSIAMQSAQIVDINGRTIKTVNLNGVSQATINVSELTSGIYFMNITTERGKISKKIIKN